MKRILFFFIFCAAMLLIPTLAKYLTDGFRIAKMQVDFPYHPEWDCPVSSDLHKILDQPFHYLAKGSQSYVFESADQNYVIKFFRFNQPTYVKMFTLFNATHIAYEHLKKETGLIYIHLNQTQMGLPRLHCKDAIGRLYQFDLDKWRFCIQKKAMPFRKTLQEALRDPLQMEKRLDQFVDLLFSRTNKGIFNTDPTLSRNFGFLETQAVEIDFGNFRSTSTITKKEEIERYAKKLRNWLKKVAPEWVAFLDQKIQRKSEVSLSEESLF